MAKNGQQRAAKERAAKTELFIGSSGEAVDIAGEVEAQLTHTFKVTRWTAGVFKPGERPLESLERQAGRTVFGVFIFAPDDFTRSRGRQMPSTRDNVLFELGLFMGRLGSDGCFVLVPKRGKVKIPSDLEGFSPLKYDDERLAEGDIASAVSTACHQMKMSINERLTDRMADELRKAAEAGEPQAPAPVPSSMASVVERHVLDAMDMVRRGQAGIGLKIENEPKFRQWSASVTDMVLDALRAVDPALPPDAYVAWLKPPDGSRTTMTLFEGAQLPPDAPTHYSFTADEGMAGKVWSSGKFATHSPKKPHEDWVVRRGCVNESYVCVPLDGPLSAGGVLGLGSNTGFEPTGEHVRVLTAFASVLAMPTATGVGTSVPSPVLG